jgi:4-hydroxy-4-methyl-2-oxoglutarate aldolase
MTVTNADFERVSTSLCERAATFSTATMHEAAGQIGALPSAIKPVARSFRVSGPAFPVSGPALDNLWQHRAIHLAKPGDVLIVSVAGHYEAGYWGEIMSTAAKMRKLGGLVIDGCVRDGHLLEGIGLPIFARGLCIRGTGKDLAGRGSLFAPIMIGDVTIHPGDLVVGDVDGVVVIPRGRAGEVLERSAQRDAKEAATIETIKTGKTTVDIYGWPLHG